MKLIKFTIILLLLLSSFNQINVQAVNPELRSVQIRADARDVWGEPAWPWSKGDSMKDYAFMSWDEIKQGSYTYSAGYLFFKARNDREQPGLEGVDDDVEMNLVFDVENLRLTGNLRAYTVSTYDYDLFSGYDDYYKKASVIDIGVNTDVTYKATVRRFVLPVDAPEKTETRTRSVNMDVMIRASVYSYGDNVYVQFSAHAGGSVSEPYVYYQLECGNPCTAITDIQWKEEETLKVSGQELIALGSEPISFELIGSLEAESYTWVLSYKHKNGYWVELDPISMAQMQTLTLTTTSEPSLAQLRDLVYEYGGKQINDRELEMKAQVIALKDGETTVSNEHVFKLRINENLVLIINGPQIITNDVESFESLVTFTASGSGEGVAQVRWLDWYFYYKDAAEEWQLACRENVDGGIQDLQVPWVSEGLNWDSWTELAGYHGKDVEELKVLEMKAVVKAVSYAETEIVTSNEHYFTVEYMKKFQLLADKKITVHPAGFNTTKVSVNYGTL
jgi:hypothetical protein